MGNHLPDEKCNLKFNKTITCWDEGIPLGNGLCGALVWGFSDGLRFSLDRGDIWDNTPFEGVYKEEFSYSSMVKLAKEGNVEEIRRIFDAPYNQPLPSKLPAGKIIFDFGKGKNVCSELSLAQAEAVITVGEDTRITSFLHAEQKAGMIRINKSMSKFSFHIENPKYGVAGEAVSVEEHTGSVSTGSLQQLHYSKASIFKGGDCHYFIQEINEDFSYGVFARFQEQGDGTEIAYFVASSNDGKDWKEKALCLLKRMLDQGYDKLLKSHAAWWDGYWSRSSVTLPDRFFEKNWYLAQYLLASCSRKGCYPMPLQGVWTADNGMLPPWKGDYHFDLNVQMCYYSYLKANHLEEGECLLDYLWDMADCGRKFARSFYHSEGLCLPSVMTLTGEPLGGWGMYALSPANQLWICQFFERYYRATGDRKFLEERAYPYLSETGEFILRLLEEKDGKYYLPISSTPEVHDDNIEAFVTPNSNYDLALMRYLFGSLEQMSQELDNGEQKRWSEVSDKLPELAVNDQDVLMLSPDESLEESHRHFSHAMAIHPLRLMSYDSEADKRIIDATILDLERLGTGYWVGFSYTWMAELYAVQRNGNGAAHQLKTFWEQHCSPNGFHLNGDYKNCGTSMFHYRPFTLEGNFCAADALQEMLLQCENGSLDLFPAVPDAWLDEKVSYENLRGEKGLLISAAMDNGKVTSLILRPQHSCRIRIRRNEKTEELLQRLDWDLTAGEEWVEVLLQEGKEYRA